MTLSDTVYLDLSDFPQPEVVISYAPQTCAVGAGTHDLVGAGSVVQFIVPATQTTYPQSGISI